MAGNAECTYPKEYPYEMDIPARGILTESEGYRIECFYETAFLVDKRHLTRIAIADFYGDPKCALIAPDETWFAVGGEGLIYFDFERGIRPFFRQGHPREPGTSDPVFLHAIRLDDDPSLRILLDPWAEYASVWHLHVPDLNLTRLKDGASLTDEPWREEVEF